MASVGDRVFGNQRLRSPAARRAIAVTAAAVFAAGIGGAFTVGHHGSHLLAGVSPGTTVSRSVVAPAGSRSNSGSTTKPHGATATTRPDHSAPTTSRVVPPSSATSAQIGQQVTTSTVPTASACCIPKTTTVPPGGTQALPAPGTYTYNTTGYEQLSISGSKRNFPAQTPITLVAKGCGQTQTWDAYPQTANQHTETTQVCPVPGGVHIVYDTTTITYYGTTTTQTFNCDSNAFIPITGGRAGQKWSFVCKSSDSTANQTATLVGSQTMTVGGQSVDTVHVHLDTQVTGASSGGGTTDFWFTNNGTMVRKTASLTASRNSAFGRVTYSSAYTLQLVSLKPS